MTTLIDLFYGNRVAPSPTAYQEPIKVSFGQPLPQSSLKNLIELCFSASGRFAVEFRQEIAKDGHRHYTVWSEILNAEVKFVCCQETAIELIGQGVSRGVIYTKTELLELVRHPSPSQDYLRNLNKIKNQFGATLVHVEPPPRDGRVL